MGMEWRTHQSCSRCCVALTGRLQAWAYLATTCDRCMLLHPLRPALRAASHPPAPRTCCAVLKDVVPYTVQVSDFGLAQFCLTCDHVSNAPWGTVGCWPNRGGHRRSTCKRNTTKAAGRAGLWWCKWSTVGN